jgi:hypothetical protein
MMITLNSCSRQARPSQLCPCMHATGKQLELTNREHTDVQARYGCKRLSNFQYYTMMVLLHMYKVDI